MSSTPQLSRRYPIFYASTTHHPVYASSGQQTSIRPFPGYQEAWSNQIRAPIQEIPSQGYVVAQTTPSTTLPTVQGNYASLCYIPQTSQAASQSTSQWNTSTVNIPALKQPVKSYKMAAQTRQVPPYVRHHVLTPSQGKYNETSTTTKGSVNQGVREKMFYQGPSGNSLADLENEVEVLRKQSAQDENKIKRLRQNCRRKDTTISILKQQMSWQEFKIKRLVRDCEEKDMSIKSLNSRKIVKPIESNAIETPILNGNQVEGSNSYSKYLTEHAHGSIKDELARLRLWNREVIRLQAKLCKLELAHDALKRLKKDNESQQRDIACLEHRLKTREKANVIIKATSSRNLTSCVESSSN